jgi:hypothetical protein
MYLGSEWAERWWAGDRKAQGNVYNAEAVTCRLPREHNPAQKVERVGYWHGETRVGRTRMTTD